MTSYRTRCSSTRAFSPWLISPASREESAAAGLDRSAVRPFGSAPLAELVADCDAAVAQGQLANDLVLAALSLPVAIDLYDPWLVENLHYTATLGLDPYRNDHATWVFQMSRGDFFLCSSEEQRQFYLGFLAALGRVNPERIAALLREFYALHGLPEKSLAILTTLLGQIVAAGPVERRREQGTPQGGAQHEARGLQNRSGGGGVGRAKRIHGAGNLLSGENGATTAAFLL